MNKSKFFRSVFLFMVPVVSNNLFGMPKEHRLERKPSKIIESELYQAAEKGDLQSVSRALFYCENPSEKTSYGWNSLHVAIDEHPDNIDLANILINYGIDVNEPVYFQAGGFHLFTPLHFAARKGSAKMVKFLISKGANIDPLNATGQTPYDLAIYEGCTHFTEADRYGKIIALLKAKTLNRILISSQSRPRSNSF